MFQLNSLASVILDLYTCYGWSEFMSASCEVALRWMPQNTFDDDKSTQTHEEAWCHQATSNYLGKCWPRSMSIYMVSSGHDELISTKCPLLACCTSILCLAYWYLHSFDHTLITQTSEITVVAFLFVPNYIISQPNCLKLWWYWTGHEECTFVGG